MSLKVLNRRHGGRVAVGVKQVVANVHIGQPWQACDGHNIRQEVMPQSEDTEVCQSNQRRHIRDTRVVNRQKSQLSEILEEDDVADGVVGQIQTCQAGQPWQHRVIVGNGIPAKAQIGQVR